MVNLAKPRKVDESKNLLRKATKNSRKWELKTSFAEILTDFENIVCTDSLQVQSDNQLTSNAVRQLLSSLQSLLNQKNEDKCTDSQFDQITESTVKCLSGLNHLISVDSAFPESITLSALGISFLLINYYTQFSTQFANSPHSNVSKQILAACQVYFTLFDESAQINKSTLVAMFESASREDSLQTLHSIVNATIYQKTSVESKLFFRDAALLSGLLNCSSILNLFIKNMVDELLSMHPLAIKFCSLGITHEFHVLRLLNQYLKIILDNRKEIREYCKTTDSAPSYNELLLSLTTQTLNQIDHNWESPINGAGNFVKQAYRFLIDLAKEQMSESVQLKQFIMEQYRRALSLPFTCTSKYKKLSTLIPALTNEEIDMPPFRGKSIPANVKLCELPFFYEDNFAQQVVQHLSINSLAYCIAEFYKASVTSICKTYQNEPATTEGEKSKVTHVWSTHWLEALTQIFSTDSALSSSTVVQNTLLAHIFPFTMRNVPNSMAILLQAFSNNSFGQISIVRIFLEKSAASTVEKLLPPRSWLLSKLSDGNDTIRSEAIALLIEEKFIHRDRPLVCQLVLGFIRNNLNIDHAAFRHQVICKLEQFYSKVIISICDRNSAQTALDSLNETDRQVLQNVKETLNILSLSFLPGASYQRKFTALSVFSSIVTILEKEDKKGTFFSLFRQLPDDSFVPWQKLIMFALVDKDDKIRRLATEISIQFSKSQLARCPSLALKSSDFDSLYRLAKKFLCSPRHQEAHIGGLLLKCLLRCHLPEVSPFKGNAEPGLSLITALIDQANVFYTDEFRNNLLSSSISDPLHGYFLALNHCLTFITFYDGVLLPKMSNQTTFSSLLFDGRLRNCIFKPCIQLSLDSLDYFLKLLTPVNNSECEGDDLDNDNELDLCSPSFHEMCQSIESIIRKDAAANSGQENQDVYLSNDYQLIMSMCWLNIKENCFLVTTLTSLFADILSLIQENDSLCEQFSSIDLEYYLMSAEELLQIGTKMVSVMVRCRHKGVIEACGVSLTKFTRTILRIQVYLYNSKHVNQQMRTSFRKALESFVGEILSIIDFRQVAGSSVTRRSAGLALIIQAVLVGEAEAIYLDEIRPFQEGVNPNSTLYERVIAQLVSIATWSIPKESLPGDLQFVDLPQSNAMHVLGTIIGTSVLSHLSSQTVEQLFPMCVTGFTSPLWQIRNASLQLFGACITRMLGQKKRFKSTGTDLGNEFGTTITFDEFASRYPSLLGVISGHFAHCSQSTTGTSRLHPELVPVLALLASFTALGATDRQLGDSAQQLVQYLLDFLGNPIWKVRMLAARALTNLWPLHQLKHFVDEWTDKDPKQINVNLLHGLLCCTSNLFELRSLTSPEDMVEYRAKYESTFSTHLTGKCDILCNLACSIFHPIRGSFDDDDQLDEELSESMDCAASSTVQGNSTTGTLALQLTAIKEKVNFKKSDDIRHQAALDLVTIIRELDLSQLSQVFAGESVSLLVSIVLTLLEDEERAVRVHGQRIVTFLYRHDHPESSLQLLNQTVAIDYFFSWLSAHASSEQVLLKSLITRLASSINLKDYLSLFSRQGFFDKHCEFVLFEREEKNVFAEPYAMTIRIAGFLKSAFSKGIFPLLPAKGTIQGELDRSCAQLGEIMMQGSWDHLDTLMFLSIWKLPDFFARLASLFSLLSLLEAVNQSDAKWTHTLAQIKSAFPFLVRLQNYIQSPGGDMILHQNE